MIYIKAEKEDKQLVILSSITIIVHDILHYMKAKYKSKEDNKSEISVEKKMPDGEYKVLIKSSKIDDSNKISFSNAIKLDVR